MLVLPKISQAHNPHWPIEAKLGLSSLGPFTGKLENDGEKLVLSVAAEGCISGGVCQNDACWHGDDEMAESNRDIIGKPIEDLDTPALLLDRGASQRNLRRMAQFFRGRKCRLRPHFKNHKCTALARRQLEAGSVVGFTCAKLGEAEVLAEAGLDDLLLANQVVGRRKIERLVRLAGRIKLRVAVDHPAQAQAISAAASAVGATVGVLVEVDIGMGRCGVSPGEPALVLARQIAELDALRFDGLQAYEGHLVYLDDARRRAELVREAIGQAVETRRLIEQHGIPVGVISGGASATYEVTGQIDGVDEIQAGSYATMDWRYAELAPQFEIALSVLTRVISVADGVASHSTAGQANEGTRRAVLDVGLKGVGTEFGPPRIKGYPGVETPSCLAEEHCIVRRAADWQIGQTLELLPSHCCTTSNLYRQFHVHENGRIVDVWPIEASGKLA